jgi:sugar lactone lactonase YvrE
MERMVPTTRLIAAATIIAALGMTSAASAQVSVSLDTPQGVAVSPSGMVYISDFNHNVIRRITPAGKVSIFAGNGQFGAPTPGPATMSALNYPIGIALHGGALYVVDLGNSVVEKISGGTLSIVAGIPGRSGNPTPGPATQSMLRSPISVAVDATGNIYIADQGIQFGQSNVVEKISTGGTLSIFAGEVAASGYATPGPATQSMLNYPQGVAADGRGNVYIADMNQVIEKVTTRGMLSIFAGVQGGTGTPTPGPATQSHFNDPNGVATDAYGNVYVADSGNDRIEKISSGVLSFFAGNGSRGAAIPGLATSSMLNLPVTMAAAGRSVYIADTYNNSIDKVTGGVLSIFAD